MASGAGSDARKKRGERLEGDARVAASVLRAHLVWAAERIRIENCPEYSPVFCLGGRGYYAEVLRTLGAPGPVVVDEVACQCSGDAACVFELRW